MAAKTGGGSFVQPLHPPCPKSPPKYPDLYGKRREKAKVQMLEREISFLEEELKSVEGFQPASRSCKEVTDFVMENSDPYIPPLTFYFFVSTNRKNRKSCGFRRWLCGLPCCNLQCLCCCCNSGFSRCDDHVTASPATAAALWMKSRVDAVRLSVAHVIAIRVQAAAEL
ncbi:guanine nucleotide-binding protein subunit gamma 3-like [Hibiscus syriacus]|uniref:guanine nucleotide-binding protein subunit gamma 3-like n=1 Tax=Hibiscus syriacus TaxID=106335 RepID=UPI0019241732|nr:guanine nucleotide-binding protein subunit gamma 3-like [Hibiscus syriacus]